MNRMLFKLLKLVGCTAGVIGNDLGGKNIEPRSNVFRVRYTHVRANNPGKCVNPSLLSPEVC